MVPISQFSFLEDKDTRWLRTTCPSNSLHVSDPYPSLIPILVISHCFVSVVVLLSSVGLLVGPWNGRS
ncbi:hypothetical protein VNO78_14933 [Psophocarpus tetragonolobus]|uniref:Uncharacterized protein n=1 Tax=Psophocarpus tetragonolobus TaxID=3891 RepID=A0AAN9SFH9_PSOTE